MNAQRLTTLSSRVLAGLSSSLLLHSQINDYLGIQIVVQLGIIVGIILLLFNTEYNPRDNSKAERLKADRASWSQFLILCVGLSIFCGGLILWVT
jgi:hypothetical protein